MSKPEKPRDQKPGMVQDEPGAEERFKGILKRALNTPPPRKQDAKQKRKQKATGKKP